MEKNVSKKTLVKKELKDSEVSKVIEEQIVKVKAKKGKMGRKSKVNNI